MIVGEATRHGFRLLRRSQSDNKGASCYGRHKHISDTNKDITRVESENLRTVSKSVAHLSNRRRKQSMAVFAARALHLYRFLSFILSL